MHGALPGWRRALVVVVLPLAGLGLSGASLLPRPTTRPWFLPAAEEKRIEAALARGEGGALGLPAVRRAAQGGDGFWAAWLWAVEEDPAQLEVARRWLLRLASDGGDLGKRARQADDAFFVGGQPWLGDVYYEIDTRPFRAYDWVHEGLSGADRAAIEQGFLTSARFRMRAMDRWTQTPNLMFKPTVMVALAGLATGNEELREWGFLRQPGSNRGGYLSVLDVMLRGGPWAEAPIYAADHRSLFLMLRTSRLLEAASGTRWAARRGARGGSPLDLMDYYVDTAYPIEHTGQGLGQIRVATFGDGSTGPKGDLFLVKPAVRGRHLEEELGEAWAATGDRRYAAFLGMAGSYEPNPVDRPPLVAAPLPKAPSRVWEDFGVAMLRSDEAPSYWTSGRAIAASLLLGPAYAHGHHDAFSLTLHGAGRLLYPDYNAVQYENPAEGWTSASIAHNTLVVDGADTRGVRPEVRSDFRSELKYVATAAEGVFLGVSQTRVLALTGEYLLDVFEARSPQPRTFDWVLHSFGRVVAESPAVAEAGLGPRYRLLEAASQRETDDAWSIDFVLDGDVLRERQAIDAEVTPVKKRRGRARPRDQTPVGDAWFAHTAAVRMRMAAEPETLVVHGLGPQRLPMLVARRRATATAFVAVHEPWSDGQPPSVTSIEVLARSATALVVEVRGRDFTDLLASALGPGQGQRVEALGADGEVFGFRGQGYVRIQGGRAAATGGWTGLVLRRDRARELRFDGRTLPMTGSGLVRVGTPPAVPPRPRSAAAPAKLDLAAPRVRLGNPGRRSVDVSVTNREPVALSVRLELLPPDGIDVEPRELDAGLVAPGQTRTLGVIVSSRTGATGAQLLPVRLTTSRGSVSSGALELSVGSVLRREYRQPEAPTYEVDAPRYRATLDMRTGAILGLANDAGRELLAGPLFRLYDGARAVLDSSTEKAYTWPTEAPASLVAAAGDDCRWRVGFLRDRLFVTLDPVWTRFAVGRFLLGGAWASPKARWAEARRSDGSSIPAAGAVAALAGAELRLDAAAALCVGFRPSRDVRFEGGSLEFELPVKTGETWSAGPCAPGELADWLSR